jgi:hypothetical protein
MDRPSHTDPAPDLHTLQVQVLYRNMPTGVLASAINAAVLAAVEWSVVPHTPLLLWVIGLWMVAAARALLILNYRRARPTLLEQRRLAPLDAGDHQHGGIRMGQQRVFSDAGHSPPL